jgi:DNA primase
MLAVGVPSAGSCNQDHVADVAASGAKRVILAFDADDAGQKGRTNWTRALRRAGRDCFIFKLVKGCKDLNDQIVKRGCGSLGLGAKP